MIIWIAVMAAVVVLDQVSKILVLNFLDREEPFVLIKNVFRFSYVENRGAAFGSLSDNRWIFMIVSTIAIVALLVYLFKWKPQSRLACLAISFIIGGGIGNMIDRVYLGYVVDFIDFYAFPDIWMWVFNIADAFVCIGAGMLILWCILSIIEDGKKAKAEKMSGDIGQNENADITDNSNE